ncbi:hypothetical protein PT2222_320079 [Paraburkholderia tropica]
MGNEGAKPIRGACVRRFGNVVVMNRLGPLHRSLLVGGIRRFRSNADR